MKEKSRSQQKRKERLGEIKIKRVTIYNIHANNMYTSYVPSLILFLKIEDIPCIHISNIFIPSVPLTFKTSRKFVTAQKIDNFVSRNSNQNSLAKQETGVLCLATNRSNGKTPGIYKMRNTIEDSNRPDASWEYLMIV